MRVVAGEFRGRRLQAPEGADVRPTSDRVREAVFNALGSLGAVERARVLDLFAGTGALGIEALSRGAAHATFVERSRVALRTLESNLAALDLLPRSTVLRADATSPAVTAGARFDLAFVDPPYAFDGWEALLAWLPADLAVLESDRELDPPPGWRVLRCRRYGGTVVTFSSRGAPEHPGPAPTTSGDTTP